MKTIVVKKLRVGSFAKVIAITQAIIAFVYGAIISFLVIADYIKSDSSLVENIGTIIGILLGLAVFILPALAYVLGWIQGAVVAIILNFVFKESRGLEIEIEDVK